MKEVLKFGSVDYFEQYLLNAIKSENGGFNTLHRIYYSFSSFILREIRSHNETLKLLTNLEKATHKVSMKLEEGVL